MSARITSATAVRVLSQLRRDPRTIGLLLAVPPLLLVLFKYTFDGAPATFQHIGVPLIGLFPFITMFLVTSITMLRERTTGTLERLMTMPLAKLDLLVGYAVAFGALAAIQALITAGVGFGPLGLHTAGSGALIIALAIGNAVLGMALGLFTSAFARSEFQAIQFLPAVVFPQLILCGLFAPRNEMAPLLQVASYAMPLTYAFDALQRATNHGTLGGRGALDIVVIAGAIILALILGAGTLRRRTP